MMTFYGYNTINSLKVLLALLEMKLDYRFKPVNIRAGEQHEPAFQSINPAGKVPVIIDDGFLLTESNAILLYLARKTGWGQSDDPHVIDKQNAWLFYQASSQGPYFGQVEYWSSLAPTENPAALTQYKSIANRSIAYLNTQLVDQDYLCANRYSIADIALFPWINDHAHLGLSLDDAPNVVQWLENIRARPATQEALTFFGDDAIFQARKGRRTP